MRVYGLLARYIRYHGMPGSDPKHVALLFPCCITHLATTKTKTKRHEQACVTCLASDQLLNGTQLQLTGTPSVANSHREYVTAPLIFIMTHTTAVVGWCVMNPIGARIRDVVSGNVRNDCLSADCKKRWDKLINQAPPSLS
ncbi:hypothetical protein MRB53_038077 [Persea americana]|nr:hypothetical protein MRB53_038077 [Persea americana]